MRVHIDFVGPVQGKMLLIAVDTHPKWIETQPMTTTTARATEADVCNSRDDSVNDPQFVSHEYEDFCKLEYTESYHSSSNGLAVKTVEQGISKMTEGTLQDKL